jgi:WD40 repeat protein
LEFKAEKAAAVARNKANLERERAARLKKTDED